MFKLLKEILRTGDATVQYPFAPYEVSKDFRGKPEHNAEKCIACAACTIACPPNAIHMETDLEAGTRTWSIDYGRCIFCARCEESCPTGAIALTPEFELAVMTKEDLTVKAVFQLERCRTCGKPFAPAKEVEYVGKLLAQTGGEHERSEREEQILHTCPECKRQNDLEQVSRMKISAQMETSK